MRQTATMTACLLAAVIGAGSANATVDPLLADTQQQAEFDTSGETGPEETGWNFSPAPGFEIATRLPPPQSRPADRPDGVPVISDEDHDNCGDDQQADIYIYDRNGNLVAVIT